MKPIITLIAFFLLLSLMSELSAHQLPPEVKKIVDESMLLQGDLDAGKQIATSQCMFCHGMEGVPVDLRESPIPYIADQAPKYFVIQLAMFKTMHRRNPIMNNFAEKLSAQDIADLREYYTSQVAVDAHCKDAPAGTPMPSSLNHVSDAMRTIVKSVERLEGNVENGRILANTKRSFRTGDGGTVAISCADCHGRDGVMEDNVRAQTMHPDLASLGRSYMVRSMASFKTGDRVAGPMALLVKGLSNQDLADLAAYYSQINRCK